MVGTETNRLWLLRAERKVKRLAPWRQDLVATACGLTPSRYQRIESGTPPDPTPKEIAAIAKFYGVPESRLGLKARKSGRAA
jgi:transcriptional regulator with XRE-family HTH domain